jgi:ABC-type multidrug transport system fused ATPase/permease subunit
MSIIARLFAFVRPYWWASLGSVLLLVAVTGLRMAPAWFTRPIIDVAIPAGDVGQVGLYVGLFVGSAVIFNLLNAVELYLEQFVGQRVIYDLRSKLYSHLQSQSMSFYDTHQIGQLMSRVTNDVSQVQFFLTQGFTRLVTSLVTIAIYVVVLVILDLQLMIVALLIGPLIWYLQRHLRTVMPLVRLVQRRTGDMNVLIQEYVAGVKMIQGFGREAYEAKRFDAVNREIRSARMVQAHKMAVVMPGQELCTNISLALVLAVGAWRVMDGSLTIGTLVAFQAYVLTMWQPVRFFGQINQMSQQAIAAGERVFDILDTPLDVAERPGAVDLGRIEGRIDFEAVSFAYGHDRPLLEEVTFSALPGQTVAIVGPSGSGKSTIVNLIPRFYDATVGAVRIDGHDVRDIRLASLRSQLSLVLQETFLFNLTIRENIRYGRPDASDADVEAAARAAHAHEFISDLVDGYDTMVGERGIRLSGGQRQRIAIARALLVDPRILILDEATSSVDARTDAAIQTALDGLMRERTTIVIAHRIGTVQRADLILVLQDGRIVDRGTHDELRQSSVLYAHLCEAQLELRRDAETGLSAVSAPLETTGA